MLVALGLPLRLSRGTWEDCGVAPLIKKKNTIHWPTCCPIHHDIIFYRINSKITSSLTSTQVSLRHEQCCWWGGGWVDQTGPCVLVWEAAGWKKGNIPLYVMQLYNPFDSTALYSSFNKSVMTFIKEACMTACVRCYYIYGSFNISTLQPFDLLLCHERNSSNIFNSFHIVLQSSWHSPVFHIQHVFQSCSCVPSMTHLITELTTVTHSCFIQVSLKGPNNKYTDMYLLSTLSQWPSLNSHA